MGVVEESILCLKEEGEWGPLIRAHKWSAISLCSLSLSKTPKFYSLITTLVPVPSQLRHVKNENWTHSLQVVTTTPRSLTYLFHNPTALVDATQSESVHLFNREEL